MVARPTLLVRFVATAGGAGLSPVAPGTLGTLVAVPLAWALGRAGGIAYAAGAVLVTLVGTWAAGAYVRASGQDDDQRIVVDEVAGYLVTLATVPRRAMALVCGFALFRLFDVWKPWPISVIDRRVHGGLGVMADDLAAGVYAGVLLHLAWRAGWLDRAAAAVGMT